MRYYEPRIGDLVELSTSIDNYVNQPRPEPVVLYRALLLNLISVDREVMPPMYQFQCLFLCEINRKKEVITNLRKGHMWIDDSWNLIMRAE